MQIKSVLNGKEINLTGDNATIKSNNFNVDKDGNMTCSNATISGSVTSSNVTITGGTVKINKGSASAPSFKVGETYMYEGQLVMEDTNGDMVQLGYMSEYFGPTLILCDNGTTYSYYGATKAQINELLVTGNLNVNGQKNRVVSTKKYGKRLLNAYETATPYFGDIGSAKTDEVGKCRIYIDEIFLETVEADDYKVFIQLNGEGNAYVKKYKKYFEIIGPTNTELDWEIKAIQKGYKNVRLKEYQ